MSENPVDAAREAYRRAHPRQADAVDEAMSLWTEQDSEPGTLQTPAADEDTGSEQLLLGDVPGLHPGQKSRGDDPATAKLAARQAFPRAGVQRHKILLAIAGSERGLTYDDVTHITGIIGVSVSTRISELADGDWIEEDGDRKTSAGGTATVWIASAKAMRAIESLPQ